MLVEIRDKVATLKKQGKSLPEVVAAKPGARYDAEWGNLFMTPAALADLVYQGVGWQRLAAVAMESSGSQSPWSLSRGARWRGQLLADLWRPLESHPQIQ